MRANPTPEQFIDHIQANYALASVVAQSRPHVRVLQYETGDDHAVHVLELIATRAGLVVTVKQYANGAGIADRYLVRISGFQKDGRASRSLADTVDGINESAWDAAMKGGR